MKVVDIFESPWKQLQAIKWQVLLLLTVMILMIALTFAASNLAKSTQETWTEMVTVIGLDKPTEGKAGRVIVRAEDDVYFIDLPERDYYLQDYRIGDCAVLEFSQSEVTPLRYSVAGKCGSPGGE